ncbi:hypothetical protein F0562_025658 [Nyssa sinensis]|uniref:BED-type domain-containing protein n=1 Tax=Nyssa sinensis TaxID=561372 RepID=A0A5J5B9B7_9ASTE|nr:hypothetical protein F0562_025658 [Nyssa sinensis]
MEDIDQDGIDVGSISNDERNNGNDEGNNENVGNEANDTQNEDADPHKHAFQRKPRKRTSTIWNDFEEVVDADGSKKVKCNYCLAKFNMPSTGVTTQFHRHLKRCTQHQLASKKQMVLSVETVASDCAGSIANFKYDRAKVRELAAHMTLYHEYPFMQMEDVIFNKFMRANTPYWQKITRTTIKNDCISAYEIEKKKLKTFFKSINKVNITTNMWKSSNQKIGYMVVTGHFIDSDWNLQKRVLNFFHVPPPHSGVIVADALQKCFIEWGIEDKVSTITVDNARYNDVALRILKDNFTLKKKLSFGGRIFHVRCCAHIINLLVQDGIKEVKGIVDIVREGVKYLIASDARMIQFSDIAKQLQLSSKKLILDCPTRWNSTYMMLATALEFREVFPRYQDRDPSFIYMPSVEDWVKVEHVCDFLGTFNVITNIISRTEYPTANLFLSELWRIKVLLNEKSVDDNEFIRAMASMMKARNIVTVKQALYEIYNEYVVTHAATHTAQGEGGQGTTTEIGSSSASSGDHDIGKKIVSGSSLILGHVSRTVDTIHPSKSDLDIYLDESAFICPDGSANKFDIMGWWKANTLKFRILSKMARDILSIPITSVASESTFSAGGRVIDPYRASLLPETVQVLLCGADWVRALHGLKKGSEIGVLEDIMVHLQRLKTYELLCTDIRSQLISRAKMRSTFDNLDLLKNGLPGALVTALILGVHEISHILVAKSTGVKLGVPYLVPSCGVIIPSFSQVQHVTTGNLNSATVKEVLKHLMEVTLVVLTLGDNHFLILQYNNKTLGFLAQIVTQ